MDLLKTEFIKKDNNFWTVFLVAFIGSWIILGLTSTSLSYKASMGEELAFLIFLVEPFRFLFYFAVYGLLTFILFLLLRKTNYWVFLPLTLGLVFMGYFYFYGERRLVDLSTKSWMANLPLYLPPMIAYCAIAFQSARSSKRWIIFGVSAILGLVVAICSTFPTQATDQILFSNHPEMTKINIRKLITTDMIPEIFGKKDLMIYWDRGLRQIANINSNGSSGKNYWGEFQVATGIGKNHVDSSVNIFDLFDRESTEVDDVTMKRYCSHSVCRYAWDINSYYFQLDLHCSTAGFESDPGPERVTADTADFAHTLVRKSVEQLR